MPTATQADGRDRRVHPRVPAEAEARYRLLRGSQSTLKAQAGKLYNVSAGGICLDATREIRPGDILKVEIELPDKNGTITSLVEVTWTDLKGAGSRIGCRYVAMRPEEAQVLSAFLQTKIARG